MACERIGGGIRRNPLAGGRVQFGEIDAVPERAERHPQPAVGGVDNGRVDRVVWILSRVRLNHRPLVGPQVIRIGRVERRICGQADGRILAAK